MLDLLILHRSVGSFVYGYSFAYGLYSSFCLFGSSSWEHQGTSGTDTVSAMPNSSFGPRRLGGSASLCFSYHFSDILLTYMYG